MKKIQVRIQPQTVFLKPVTANQKSIPIQYVEAELMVQYLLNQIGVRVEPMA